jgi:hypothetical protein
MMRKTRPSLENTREVKSVVHDFNQTLVTCLSNQQSNLRNLLRSSPMIL